MGENGGWNGRKEDVARGGCVCRQGWMEEGKGREIMVCVGRGRGERECGKGNVRVSRSLSILLLPLPLYRSEERRVGIECW